MPVDQVSLAFAKIEVDYRPQTVRTGRSGRPSHFGFDLKQNKSSSESARSVEPLRRLPPPGRPEPPTRRAPRQRRSWRACCGSAGYRPLAIQERLGDRRRAARAAHRSCRPIFAGSATPTGSPSCFGSSCSASLSRARVSRRCSTHRFASGLGTARLLVDDGEAVHGAARIVPHDELLIASDHAAAAEDHADHVPGVHRPSVALAHLTVAAVPASARSTSAPATESRRSCSPRMPSTSSRRTSTSERFATQVQCGAERRRQHRDPARKLLRTGRGRALRPRRREPALRRLAGERVPVPGQRHGGGLRLRARRPRRVPRSSRRAATPRCSSPGRSIPTIRRSGRAPGWRARVATRSCSTPRRTTRSRRRPSGTATSRPPRGVRGRTRPLARLLPPARDRAPRLRLPRPPETPRRRGTAADSFQAAAASQAALRPAGEHVATALRDARPARGAATTSLARPAAACRRRRGRRPDSRFAGGRWHVRGLDAPARPRAALLRRAGPIDRALLAELDGSQTLEQALAAAVEGVDREEGLELARRMLEIGFLELADEEDAR